MTLCLFVQGHRNLSQLPNFSFSVALAYFHLDRNKKADADKADEMVSFRLRFNYFSLTLRINTLEFLEEVFMFINHLRLLSSAIL